MTNQPPAGVALKPFVSVTCEGEVCRCGRAAVRKVGEEIPLDDPNPHRHNLTAYVCADCFSALLGPVAARSVEAHRTPASGAVEAAALTLTDDQIVQSLRDHYEFARVGPWPGVQTPHYALIGLFKMAADRLAALTSEPKAEGEAPDFYQVGEFIGTRPVLCEHGHIDPNNLCPYCEGDLPYPGRVTGAPQPLQGGEVTREAVARAIDPNAWGLYDEIIARTDANPDALSNYTAPSLAKAEKAIRIVHEALISPAQREGEG